MKKIQRQALCVLSVLALLAFPTMLAAAKELSSLTISGPGIPGQVTLEDPKEMMDLQQSGFFDTTSFIKPPADLGAGYTLTTHLNLDSQVVPFLEMVYYPAARGEAGYVHITGRLNGDTMQASPADDWARVQPAAAGAFADLLASHQITLQVAVPSVRASAAASTAAPASTMPAPAATLAAVAALVVLAGAVLLIRRRAGRRRSAPGAD
jgi:hypothetical protein